MQEETDYQNYPDIPGYKILSELGRGGIATVYLALQESLDRQVALKVMSPLLAMEPDYAERFIREGRTVAQLSHPNIITVYDIGLQKHQLFIAMEYIPGGNMRTLMMEHENDPEWALSVAGQIALALGYAHTIGIVHRDVKPENILFRESGAAVLTDFGIAKTITSNTNLTRAGTIIGTPKYMSPEQTDGVGNDPTTDIYSLGIILYEMLTGQVPYDSENSMAVLYAHVNSPIPELPKELSDLQPLLNNLLAKKAEERTDDCDELAEIIRITRRERHYALKNPEKMEKMKDTGLATDLIQPVKKKSRAKRRRKKSETKAANIIESLKGVFSIADGKHGNNGRLKQIGLGLLGVVIVFSLISIWTGGPDDAAEEANSDLQTANNTASDGNDNSIQKYIDSKNQQPETAATLSGPDTITPVDEPATLDNAIENESPVADESVAEKIDDNLADDDTQAEVVAEKEIDSAQTDQTEILISRFLADESHDELVKQNLAMAPRNEEEEKETAALATRQKEINGLLTKARRAVKDERITTPKDDNAVSYYKQVLELSPRNSRALRGLNVSGDLIYEQIKEKYASDDQDLALRQINATLLSIPNHIKLTALKKSIEASFNPNSSYAKAEKLYRGVDGTKNPSRAAFYYLKAAELGHIQAMNAIGVAYADGDGVVHSDRRAMNWFKKSAQYGNSEAMYNAALGYLFSNVKDPSKAWNWAKKSSDNEYRPAYMLAGWMKTTGTGTRANRFGSIGWDLKGMVNPISSKLDKQYRIPEKWQDIFMVEYRATTNTGPP